MEKLYEERLQVFVVQEPKAISDLDPFHLNYSGRWWCCNRSTKKIYKQFEFAKNHVSCNHPLPHMNSLLWNLRHALVSNVRMFNIQYYFFRLIYEIRLALNKQFLTFYLIYSNPCFLRTKYSKKNQTIAKNKNEWKRSRFSWIFI